MLRVLERYPANEAVNRISLFQKELRKIRPILSCYPSDKGNSSAHFLAQQGETSDPARIIGGVLLTSRIPEGENDCRDAWMRVDTARIARGL